MMKYRFRDGDLQEDEEWLSCYDLRIGGLYVITPLHPITLWCPGGRQPVPDGTVRFHVEYLGYKERRKEARKYEFRNLRLDEHPVPVIQCVLTSFYFNWKFFKAIDSTTSSPAGTTLD
jgi:hypothetical protein